MSSAHASYRQVQTFTLLWLTLPLAALVAGAGALAAPRSAPLLIYALALPTLFVLLLVLLGRLVIELRGRDLHWSFGYVGWPRWQVALDEIERMEVTRSRALQGAGIKGLGRRRLFNVQMGGPVLQLDLRDGRTIQLGTPEPQRLRGFIEARGTVAPTA
jgi:hypothetical protein